MVIRWTWALVYAAKTSISFWLLRLITIFVTYLSISSSFSYIKYRKHDVCAVTSQSFIEWTTMNIAMSSVNVDIRWIFSKINRLKIVFLLLDWYKSATFSVFGPSQKARRKTAFKEGRTNTFLNKGRSPFSSSSTHINYYHYEYWPQCFKPSPAPTRLKLQDVTTTATICKVCKVEK